MKFYITRDAADPTKYVVISGYPRPKCAIADAPEEVTEDRSTHFIKKVGEGFVFDQEASDTYIAKKAQIKAAMEVKKQNKQQALQEIKDLDPATLTDVASLRSALTKVLEVLK